MKKISKIASVLTAAMLFAAVPQTSFAEKSVFSDISAEKYSWAAGYIEDMYAQGFISGYDDGTFKPDKDITRLEALSLFARTMKSEATAAAMERAKEKYGSVVANFELNFGSDDICYLLYRGALKESELSNYLDDEVRNQPMPRHEAAAIITKALCAEKKAASEIMIVLDYSDAKQIPDNASKYVYFVTNAGIMSGMGDGTFSPNSGVKRSQMAVMLSKMVDAMGLTVENLKIAGIDEDDVYFYDEDHIGSEEAEPEKMGYNSDTKFYLAGELIQAKNVPSDVNALFTYVRNELAYVDIENSEPDRTISGTYQGCSRTNGVYVVALKTDDGVQSFTLADDAEVIYSNSVVSSVRDFTENAKVTAYVSGGKIVKIKGEPKQSSITKATIEEMSIIDDNCITISHANDSYDGLKLEVSPSVKVIKNDSTASLADIYKGDVVDLTLEYGIVTSIKAESVTRIVSGTIKSIEISSSPKITIDVNGKENTYDITSDITIVINNKDATLYDFRVGDSVSLSLESKAVKKITATSSSSIAYSKTGVITAVNESYKFIKISYTENDSTREEIVYCKDNVTKFITSEGTTQTLKNLNVGDTVSVRGTMTNGAFEASLVLIEIE